MITLKCCFREPTWQFQDLRQRDAVVESRGDDAFRPRSLGTQLIHLFTGVQAVFAHVHPVIGGCRDHNAQPAEKADEKPAQLKTRVRHSALLCLKTACPRVTNCENFTTKVWSNQLTHKNVE